MNLVGHVIKTTEKAKSNGHIIESHEDLGEFQKI